MNHTLESALRFVNLTASGLLAGSLSFGEAALVPGWENERPTSSQAADERKLAGYFNAIGPVALATSMTLAIGVRNQGTRRVLDTLSTLGLVGVLAATTLVTVPINRQLIEREPVDYPREESHELVRNWGRAHAVRTAMGVGAFVCAVASAVTAKKR